MKHLKTIILVSLGALFSIFQSCEKKEDTIWNVNVTTENENVKTAYLYAVNNEREKVLIDSTIVQDKTFHFKGENNQEALGVYYLDFDKSQKGGVTFLISNGDKLKINLKEQLKSEFKGTAIAGDFNKYNAFKQSEIDGLMAFTQIISNPEVTPDEINSKMVTYREEVQKNERDKIAFIKSIKNPELNGYLVLEEILTSSVIDKEVYEKFYSALTPEAKTTARGKKATMIVNLFDAYKLSHEISFLDYATAKQQFDQLSEEGKNSSFGNIVSESLISLEKLGIGQAPPALEAATITGKAFNLNQVKDKIVLIDFWASWCGPCRLENPNYKKLYNAYKNNGFNIIGYSLDTDKAKWQEAVEKDGLDWINVSNLKKQSDDDILKAYQVGAIPANLILVDGIIAARNLFGTELNDFLAKNF